MHSDKISIIRDVKDSMQLTCRQIYSQIQVHDRTRMDQIKKLSINRILNEVVLKLGKAQTRSRTNMSLIIKSNRMTNKLKTLNHLDTIGMTYTNSSSSSSWQKRIKIKMDYLVQVRGLLLIKNLKRIEVFKMMTMMI